MTSYTLIAPPTSLRFREMEPKELERYFAWFLASIPERIEVLSTHVRSSEPFSSWIPDRSPESLGALGEWFTHTVTLRQRTTEEIQGIYAKGPDWFTQVEVPGEELTEETFSLAMDIGMYLGEILRQSATRLQWKALKGNKQEADYGQPILQPFKGGLVCNPVRLAITLAYGLADGTYKGTRLGELYETWRARTE